jgi:hypothetical protein
MVHLPIVYLPRYSFFAYTFYFFVELDALGDDLAFDEDTSYLDEAERAPTVPDTDLPEPSANRVKYFPTFFVYCMAYYINLVLFYTAPF